jgi:hypothetical protein
MSQHEVDEDRNPRAKAPRTAAAERDERDAAIERLERLLEEERRTSVGLRDANEALRFQLQVLEKSYAKQLEDARIECVRAERAFAARQAQFSALEAECTETMRLLAEARAHFNRIAAERGRGPRRLARRDGRLTAEDSASAGEGTINELIADEHWAKPPAERAEPVAERPVQVHEDQAQNDLIAPELVFPAGDEDDEEA